MTNFESGLRKSGNSWVMTIPAHWIKAQVIDPEKVYEVTLKEIKR